MKISFGLGFDGVEHTERPGLGKTCVGPEGLYQLLATRLGIPKPKKDELRILLKFAQLLQVKNDRNRFYSDSFRQDNFSTAAKTIQISSNLILSGWKPANKSKNPGRLSDLRDMLPFFQQNISSATWKREIIDQLTKREVDLEINCTDDERHLTPDLKEIMKLTKANFISLDIQPSAPQGTDLRMVQEALLGHPPSDFKNDGTISIVEAQSIHTKADWISSIPPEDALVILDSEKAALNSAYRRKGLPQISKVQEKSLRSPSLFLKLAIGNLWHPIEPIAILEMLKLPFSPISTQESRALSKILSRIPGHEGESFEKAVSDLVQDKNDKYKENFDDIVNKYLKRKRWLESEKMPLQELTSFLSEYSKWAKSYDFSKDEGDQVRAALKSAESLQSIFNTMIESGEETIEKMLLDHIVNAALEESAEPYARKEAGSPSTVSGPEMITGAHDTVVWWGMVQPQLYKKPIWSKEEKAQLQKEGCKFLEPQDGNHYLYTTWVRAVLSAKSKLILVEPSDQSGSFKRHPFLSQLNVIGRNCEGKSVPLPEKNLDQDRMEGNGVFSDKVTHSPLPPPMRWWQVEDIEIPKREMESNSSVEKFLQAPYHWVLERHARIRPGTLQNPYGIRAIMGTVCHIVIQTYFDSEGEWLKRKIDGVEGWVEKNLESALDQEGLILRQKGFEATRVNMTGYLTKSIQRLDSAFKESNIIKIESEPYLTGKFKGGNIGGYVDMLLTNSDGKKGILDLKLSSKTKYIQTLVDFTHLQLAIYGEILRQQDGSWPNLAYFIIENSALIASDQDFFKTAFVHQPKEEGVTLPMLWQRFQDSWAFRREQLDQGGIEVTSSYTPARDTKEPPSMSLIKEYDDQFCPYRALVGFGRAS